MKIRVIGDSMLPTLKLLDIIELEPIENCSYKDVKVGEIVSYKSKGFNRKGQPRFWHKATVIHRIVGKTKKYALIKGDNRNYIEKVDYSQIIGRVLLNKNKK